MFADGIAENAPLVRTRIGDGLRFLGIEVEEKRSVANAAAISAQLAGLLSASYTRMRNG